jgi:hypothetical protein
MSCHTQKDAMRLVLDAAKGSYRPVRGPSPAWYYPLMTTQDQAHPPAKTKPGQHPEPVLHRVCIQCNNMFRVTPDHFDAKHCPNCHKG